MKKLICLIFVFTIMLTACSKWEVEIVDPTKQVESEAELVVFEEEEEQQSEVTEETNDTEESSESSEEAELSEEKFFPAAGAYFKYGFEYIRGRAVWNEDNTLTFQHENTINTISAENEIIETVELPKEYLPEDGAYDLYWNEKYILAIDKQEESSFDQYGVVCFDDDGNVFLANVALFDREGNLIKEYNIGAKGGYGEFGNYEIRFPNSEVFGDKNYSYLADGERVHWLDDDTVVFECHLWVVYYDFSKDEGKVLDNMSGYLDTYGKFSVYYGVEYYQCGVLNGDFYYLSHRIDQNVGNKSTIWKANENGAEELFDGKEFWHLFVGKEILIAVEAIDGNFSENGSIVYAIDPENLELKEIYRGNVSVPFGDDGKIRFKNYYNDDPEILYSYDYKTGEIIEDMENTDFSVQSIVPGYTDYVMESPDGKYFVEYDENSEEPKIRISPR